MHIAETVLSESLLCEQHSFLLDIKSIYAAFGTGCFCQCDGVMSAAACRINDGVTLSYICKRCGYRPFALRLCDYRQLHDIHV